jgi:hypothetical protein
MRVVNVTHHFESGDCITLIPTGDWHLGAADCAEDQIRADLKKYEDDPNARLILMGDLGELIGPHDKRWLPQGYMPERYKDAMLDPDGGIPSETVAHAAEILEPWAGRIWGIATGNHEMTIVKTAQRDLMTELARELGGGAVQRLIGYSGFIRATFKYKNSTKGSSGSVGTLNISVHHGWQTAGRAGSGNLINGMEKELSISDADIILRGHSHAPRIAQIIPSVRVTQTGLVEWPRLVASTGTYKVGHVPSGPSDHPYTTYETFKGFRLRTATDQLGPPIIRIYPRKKNVGAGKDPSPTIKFEVTL